ncbi:hypothetical protein CLAIMM_01964 [Cladophialophora immunda]|nr:hypothetical protein CLAIMM_01964 [Cladophialophora immunda]
MRNPPQSLAVAFLLARHAGDSKVVASIMITCSLEEEGQRVTTAEVTNDNNKSEDHDRLARLESSVTETKRSVETILSFLQEHFKDPSELLSRSSSGQNAHKPARNDPECAPLTGVQDNLNKSGPILMVRQYRSSMRRLYKEADRDIITQQILPQEVTERLLSNFMSRLGHILQITQDEDMTTGTPVRQSSPLLYAVCCLNGLRFCDQPNLINTRHHRQLYEAVRDMLGQVVLASPLPVPELYALLIMSTFEAAPRPAFEYIESWLLSGICAKQAISSIDFAQILANLTLGRHQSKDRKYLSLWNNICLINLRFAVGTGKPTSIPSEYLQHCQAILNHPEASTEDRITLAEILLLSVLCQKPRSSLLLDRGGKSQDLEAWEQKWAHLLDLPNATFLRFCREFAYLVLAMHTLERHRAANAQEGLEKPTGERTGIISNSDTGHRDMLLDTFQSYILDHALSMARVFLSMSTSFVEELPKFHYICIAYCVLVLVECSERVRSELQEDIIQVIDDVYKHFSRATDELPAAISVAVENARLGQKHSRSSKQTEHLIPTGSLTPFSTADLGPGNISKESREQFSDHPLDGRTCPGSQSSTSIHGTLHRSESNTYPYPNMDGLDDNLTFPALPAVEDFFESWMMDEGNEYSEYTLPD